MMIPKTMLITFGSCYVSFVASYLCLCSCRFVRYVYYDQACNHSLSTIIWYKYTEYIQTRQQYINEMVYHLQKFIDQQILVQKPKTSISLDHLLNHAYEVVWVSRGLHSPLVD